MYFLVDFTATYISALTFQTFLFTMQRTIFLGMVFLTVLTAFVKGAPMEEENGSDVMKRNSLLEKLGMELHR